jgi:hypothetical protein
MATGFCIRSSGFFRRNFLHELIQLRKILRRFG